MSLWRSARSRVEVLEGLRHYRAADRRSWGDAEDRSDIRVPKARQSSDRNAVGHRTWTRRRDRAALLVPNDGSSLRIYRRRTQAGRRISENEGRA